MKIRLVVILMTAGLLAGSPLLARSEGEVSLLQV